MSATRTDSRDFVVPQYEAAIQQFLYDEGPHRVSDIAQHLNLSETRTSDILHLMKEAGIVVPRFLGKPAKSHWILAEDAEPE